MINRVLKSSILGTSLIACAFFFLLSISTVYAEDINSRNNISISYPHVHAFSKDYVPLLPEEEQVIETREVLVLYSIAQNRHFSRMVRQIEELTLVLSSHWNTRFTIKSYDEVNISEVLEYPYVILVEQQKEIDAVKKYTEIKNSHQGKVYWFGCGVDYQYQNTLPTSVNNLPGVVYKTIEYLGKDNPKLCGDLPEKIEGFETLAIINDDDKKPFIVKSDKHILTPAFVPDYYSINDYTLPILDSFHHFFGHHKSDGSHPALLRLEDVNPHTYKSGRALRRINRYLKRNDVPFHVAVIPRYIYPEQEIDLSITADSRFALILRNMVENSNAVLIQHGYTHQFGQSISADGFEFWDSENNSPLQFESKEQQHLYPLNQIALARELMSSADLPVPEIWETPHYAHGLVDNDAFNHIYPIRYEHIPGIGSLPFAAKVGNTVFLPENLGYISEGIEELEEKKEKLERLKGFEDPVASVFWHPWRDISELQSLVEMIKESGFEFTTGYTLLDLVEEEELVLASTATASVIPAMAGTSGNKLLLSDGIIYTVYTVFIFGTLVYIRNRYLVSRYLRQIKNFKLSFEDVANLVKERGLELPTLSLFIPARNEGLVIGNTLRRIDKLNYPKSHLKVYVIVDERELDDDVDRTTKEVALETALELGDRSGEEYIYIIEVPKWYSGVYGDKTATYEKSTKGRALNYCLQTADLENVDMIGVLDADGRLDPHVLKEVVYNRILTGEKLLQGPVFQVSNFNNISIVGKASGLELALHHLTELPLRLQEPGRLQFLAGTNYFVDTKAIKDIGGWSNTALVEDAELAVRLYIDQGIAGSWLHSPEIEQSPASFSVYKKQRERWVRGHLDLLGGVLTSKLSLWVKIDVTLRILVSQFRFILDVGIPIIAIYLMTTGSFSFVPVIFEYVAIFLIVMSIFIWDTYGMMYRKLRMYIEPDATRWLVIGRTVQFVAFLPVFIVIQAIPRCIALYKYVFMRNVSSWYKTERTAETVIQ